MKPERVFSGQCLNPSRIQDWFGGEKHFPEIAQLVRPCRSRGSVCVASQGGLAPALRHSNHSSVDVYVDEITNKIRDDVKNQPRVRFPPRDGGMCTGTARLNAGSTQIQHEIARGA